MRYALSCNSQTLCEALVKDQLERIAVPFDYLEHGEVNFKSGVSLEKLSRLQRDLNRYGIEIISDEKKFLVQRIKNLLADMAYAELPLKQTLSIHLSHHFGFSYSYIAGCFERGSSYNIERYLILLKIERAKRLIMEDQLSVKEISELMHYSSAGHLCKQFRKTTGISITSFRRIIVLRQTVSLSAARKRQTLQDY